MTDACDEPEPQAPRPGFDEHGRQIVQVAYDAPPSADELWKKHVARNWSQRDATPKPRPNTRRSTRRIY
jgi:hypothetical protein